MAAPAAAPNPSPANDKRERILDAAVQVFAQRGFFQARVSDIAREAGVADGTIYLYFKNKDDLLISLFEDRMEGIIARFRLELDRLSGPAERLHRFIVMHLDLVEHQPQLAEVLTVELRQSSKFMREYRAPKFAEYLGILVDILESGRVAGVFRPDIEPRILCRVIFGALDEVSLVWSSARREKYAPAEAAREIWNLCARGLLTEAPPPASRRPRRRRETPPTDP
ncbi:TetR family transcriptional regulator [Myxococcota bacterium]|jgi:TetR/AcrR family fatty acid metabolism transcriptional regulator|nr:TetR family transcriptional regulator [Myxococcota bacterium]